MTTRGPESHQNTKSSVGVLILMPYGTYCLRQRSVITYHAKRGMSRISFKKFIFYIAYNILFV